MRNCPDGFVVAEVRNETTVDDLEDASFMLSCSIGSLIEFGFSLPMVVNRSGIQKVLRLELAPAEVAMLRTRLTC